ncbi:MAG: helix-turn-helix transcriptional regulator [Clostridia bacterium]|nr:helix-turn-helix transcriptional regulator [Clostridia bacterium]
MQMIQDYACKSLRRIISTCFDYAMQDLELDPEEFIAAFCKSRYVKEIENRNQTFLCGMAGSEFCRLILNEASIPFNPVQYMPLDRRTQYWWAGDMIAYYQYHSGVSFAYIFSFVSITEILRMYTVYHEMSISQFMDRMDSLAKSHPSRLAEMRKRRQLSQSELAYASTVPVKTIQAYEQKRKDINKAEAVTVLKLADTLSCSTREILEI